MVTDCALQLEKVQLHNCAEMRILLCPTQYFTYLEIFPCLTALFTDQELAGSCYVKTSKSTKLNPLHEIRKISLLEGTYNGSFPECLIPKCLIVKMSKSPVSNPKMSND